MREQEIIQDALQHKREKEEIQEENNTIAEFKKSKFAKLLIGVSIFGVLMCAVAFNDEKILAGVIGIIITGLSICSYLMGIKAINEPKKGVRTLAAVAAFVLIIPYFAAYNSYDQYTYSDFVQYEKEQLNELKQSMSKFEWPDSEIADLLPKPKSDFGHIEWESSSGFVIYVGNTSLDEYNEYVKTCREYGFTVDYDKGDDYYHASNLEGYKLDLDYEGGDIVFIRIDEPGTWDEDDTENESFDADESDEVENKDGEDEDKKTDSKNSKNGSSSGISTDFKAAMDSYEDFFDEYVDFMKKYAESDGTDTSMISKYSTYMTQYLDTMSKLENVDEEELTDEELKYYIEVQNRINNKLLDVE